MKIANTHKESLHIFSTNIWRNFNEIVRKDWLMIILKVTKTQGFTLSLEDTFLEKPQEGGQIDHNNPPFPQPFQG